MILRIVIKGFKNLKETEVYFSSFTCIAGPNGVGKSNLFDAIQFLSMLADDNLIEAATSVRVEKDKKRSGADVQNLFYHDGKKYVKEMSFEVDMIIPKTGIDHLGQEAKATTTILKYKLKIGFVEKDFHNINQSKQLLTILSEELIPLSKIETIASLKKIGAKTEWIKSVIEGKRQNAAAFIETDDINKEVIIRQDQSQGNKKKLKINLLPRTVISTANAIENPTMLIAKKEMQSWRILQFEPSSLRSSDDIELIENPEVEVNGGHLPATLYRLVNDMKITFDVKSQIAIRLTELIEDIFEIDVDKDDKRNTLTLMVKGQHGPFLPARFLSDGTLRFLALSIMQSDPQMQGIICLEEPENGIHPHRIIPMIRLLQDIACDITLPVDDDNPLRQVIINTHSPLVVGEITGGDLLFANTIKDMNGRHVVFNGLSKTWRANTTDNLINKADLISYLISPSDKNQESRNETSQDNKKVKNRPEIVGQLNLFGVV